MTELETMMRRLNAAKLSGCDMLSTMTQLNKIEGNYQYLTKQLDDKGLLSQLKANIAEFRSELEVVGCLSSSCLRTRHYLWLSDNVLRHSGLALKLAGQASEIVTVVDTSGRDPVGLGNLARMNVADLSAR
jgi:hypothetical protein